MKNLPPLQPGSVKGMGLLGRINELAAYLGQLWAGANLLVGPGLLKTATPGGVTISLQQAQLPSISRCYLLTANSPVSLPGVVGLNLIDYDVDQEIESALLGTLAGGTFTFKKTGLFLLAYTAVIEIDLSGSLIATPPHRVVTTSLQVNGTDISGSSSKASARPTANYNGYVKTTDGGALTLTIDLESFQMESPTMTVGSFCVCDPAPTGVSTSELIYDSEGIIGVQTTTVITSSCANALTDEVLVDGKIISTVPTGAGDIAVDNGTAAAITGSLPDGTAYVNTAGQALIRVVRDANGDIKIKSGESLVPPTIRIFGSVPGTVVAAVVQASLSISSRG